MVNSDTRVIIAGCETAARLASCLQVSDAIPNKIDLHPGADLVILIAGGHFPRRGVHIAKLREAVSRQKLNPMGEEVQPVMLNFGSDCDGRAVHRRLSIFGLRLFGRFCMKSRAKGGGKTQEQGRKGPKVVVDHENTSW